MGDVGISIRLFDGSLLACLIGGRSGQASRHGRSCEAKSSDISACLLSLWTCRIASVLLHILPDLSLHLGRQLS